MVICDVKFVTEAFGMDLAQGVDPEMDLSMGPSPLQVMDYVSLPLYGELAGLASSGCWVARWYFDRDHAEHFGIGRIEGVGESRLDAFRDLREELMTWLPVSRAYFVRVIWEIDGILGCAGEED